MLSCLLVRYFAATVERKLNPKLKDVPIAIVSNSTRPQVIATNVRAKQAGVLPKQTVRQAQLLCPHVEIVSANHDAYERVALEIAQLLLTYAHKVEPEYQPTTTAWYVDTTSLEELQQSQMAVENYLGTMPAFGIGSNKFVSRVASASNISATPLRVEKGNEAHFLSPFPVTLLPLDKDMQRRLPLLGIETLGQYATLPKASVLEQFGKHGRWLHDLANGIDIRPLSSYKPAPILHQEYRVDEPLTNYGIVVNILRQLADLLTRQLNMKEAGHITLVLDLENGTTLEHHLCPSKPIYTTDTLHSHTEAMLYRQPIMSGIMGVKVILTELRERLPRQLSLFDAMENKQSIFDMLPKWQVQYREVEFLHVTMNKTPIHYIPTHQYELSRATGT